MIDDLCLRESLWSILCEEVVFPTLIIGYRVHDIFPNVQHRIVVIVYDVSRVGFFPKQVFCYLPFFQIRLQCRARVDDELLVDSAYGIKCASLSAQVQFLSRFIQIHPLI